ncbi:MAG: YihY family inner membrane protein [Acidobacteria bacterium]|nr:YihY family inner membrane protein [Acidobacteriota bacterium]
MIRAALGLAWRALMRFFDHSGPDRAAAVAYYTLLSLLPLLIFLISVGVAVLGSFDRAYQGTLFLLRGIVTHLDDRSLDSLRAFVERATRFQWPGILLLAWTSKRIFASLLSALEVVFEAPSRGFARGNLVALAMVLVTGAGLLATLAVTTVVAGIEGLLLRYVGPLGAETFHGLGALFLKQALPMLITASFFYLMYRLVPGRLVGAGAAAAGALIATVLWELAKMGFAYYVRNLAHYAGLYGTLEAVIVLALWLEISVSIILYCGEVVALLTAPNRTT